MATAVLTTDASARLLGLNPALYTDRRLLMLGRLLDYLGRRWRLLGVEDALGMDAWQREQQVREMFEKRVRALGGRAV